MRYIFTGPSRLTEAQKEWCVAEVEKLEPADLYITGGAKGLDVLAAYVCADTHQTAGHVIVVPYAPYDAEGVDLILEDMPWVKIARPPAIATTDYASRYRKRNEYMFELGVARQGRPSFELHAFVFSKTFYRSGEWMTINIAKQKKVPVVFHLIPLAS